MLEVAQRLANALALRTQPYGFEKKAQQIGQKAVKSDILRAYTTPGQIWNQAKAKNIGLAKQFYKAAQQNNISLMREILQKLGMSYQDTSSFDGGAYHLKVRRTRRGGKGLVSGSTNPVVIPSYSVIDDYIKNIQERVGTGKAGWASAAKQLNVTGKIPAWVLRNTAPSLGTGALKTTADVIELTMRNNVPYINEICTPGEVRKGIDYAFSGIKTQIEKKLAARAKRV